MNLVGLMRLQHILLGQSSEVGGGDGSGNDGSGNDGSGNDGSGNDRLRSYLGQLVDVTSSTKRTFHRMREVDSLYLVEVTIQTNGTTMILV